MENADEHRQQTLLFHLMEAYVDGLVRRDIGPSPWIQCAVYEPINECRGWS